MKNNKLKEIKNILLSSNIVSILSDNILDKYSYCVKKYYDISFFKNVNVNLGNIFFFNPRLRKAFDPTEKVLNFHTLWLSNNENWKNYPKRDHSVIMESNDYNNIFGKYRYRILVPNNTNLAVVKDKDLSNVFDNHLYHLSLYKFNNELLRFFYYFEEYYGLNIPYDLENNYNSLIQTINKVDINISDFLQKYNDNTENYNKDIVELREDFDFERFMKWIIINDGSLIDTIKNYYSTDKVDLIKLEEYKSHIPSEVWVDVPCIGILNEEFNDDFNKIMYKVFEYIGKHE